MLKFACQVLNPQDDSKAPSLCFHASNGTVGSAPESKDLGPFCFPDRTPRVSSAPAWVARKKTHGTPSPSATRRGLHQRDRTRLEVQGVRQATSRLNLILKELWA